MCLRLLQLCAMMAGHEEAVTQNAQTLNRKADAAVLNTHWLLWNCRLAFSTRPLHRQNYTLEMPVYESVLYDLMGRSAAPPSDNYACPQIAPPASSAQLGHAGEALNLQLCEFYTHQMLHSNFHMHLRSIESSTAMRKDCTQVDLAMAPWKIVCCCCHHFASSSLAGSRWWYRHRTVPISFELEVHRGRVHGTCPFNPVVCIPSFGNANQQTSQTGKG